MPVVLYYLVAVSCLDYELSPICYDLRCQFHIVRYAICYCHTDVLYFKQYYATFSDMYLFYYSLPIFCVHDHDIVSLYYTLLL